jgi:hypothetical protein
VAIGAYAGTTNQHANSIIINATGSSLASANASALYIAPVRQTTQSTIIGYDTSSNELTYYPRSVVLDGMRTLTTTATTKPNATFYDLTLNYTNTDPTHIFGEWRGRIWDGSSIANTTSFMRFTFRISRVGATVNCGVGTMELSDATASPYVDNLSIASATNISTVVRITLYTAASATGINTQGVLLLQEHDNTITSAAWA